MATVSPAATRAPTSTNGGAPGDGARQKSPTEGDSIFVPGARAASDAGPVAAGDPPLPPVAKASSATGPPTAPPADEAFSTSRLTMRPAGPLPESCARSTPSSEAMRRASGEALTLPSADGAAGGTVGGTP